jgi:hypothetical protein
MGCIALAAGLATVARSETFPLSEVNSVENHAVPLVHQQGRGGGGVLGLGAAEIVPKVLGEMMKDPDRKRAARVAEAMLKMVKLDIAGLQKAYGG